MIAKIESEQVCPHCGYVIYTAEKTMSRYNYPCPRCKEFGIKNFELVTRTIVDTAEA